MTTTNNNKQFSSHIAFMGLPNSGKSTLLNSLLGVPFSATSQKAQTTRSVIKGILFEEDIRHFIEDTSFSCDGQLIMLDTPGLNFRPGLLGRHMIQGVQESVESADIVVWLQDARSLSKNISFITGEDASPAKEYEWILDRMKKPTSKKQKWILALTKVDSINKNNLLPLMQKIHSVYGEQLEVVPIAAIEKKNSRSNLDGLLKVLVNSSQDHHQYYEEGQWTDLKARDFIANLVRGSIFIHLNQELPYEVECCVESVTGADEGRKAEVEASIWVSRDGMKGIVLGKGGAMIKKIGTLVRENYQKITEQDLVLKLQVKVVPNWPSQPKKLRELGYEYV